MAAMQAEVEPHFLFNTLASIDHLIEVDPPRASQMQKNLIALLRASMPTCARERHLPGPPRRWPSCGPLRDPEGAHGGTPAGAHRRARGLLSAEFPPAMLQSLVENAIKAWPGAQGGRRRGPGQGRDRARQLEVTVSDTAAWVLAAPDPGTGVRLANIRERLQLHFGPAAAEHQPEQALRHPHRDLGALPPHPDRMKP